MSNTSFVRLTPSFPHDQDDAFETLLQMESLMAEIVPIHGTAVHRNRVQRALARLADSLIESASGVTPARQQRLLEIAVLSCRRIAGFLRVLKYAAVLNIQQHERRQALVKQITELLTRRLASLIGALPGSRARSAGTEHATGSATTTETSLPNSPSLESSPSSDVAEPAPEEPPQRTR